VGYWKDRQIALVEGGFTFEQANRAIDREVNGTRSKPMTTTTTQSISLNAQLDAARKAREARQAADGGKIRCGHCKRTHRTAQQVRECSRHEHDLSPASILRDAALSDSTGGGYHETHPDGRCKRCAGTGEFITGNVNGKPTGPGGICFRCNGKGHQTNCGVEAHMARATEITGDPDADVTACCDRMRNTLYDMFGIRVYI